MIRRGRRATDSGADANADARSAGQPVDPREPRPAAGVWGCEAACRAHSAAGFRGGLTGAISAMNR